LHTRSGLRVGSRPARRPAKGPLPSRSADVMHETQ
jgi:hypothetical protein